LQDRATIARDRFMHQPKPTLIVRRQFVLHHLFLDVTNQFFVDD
jgi:hypothetical protein